MAKSLLGLSDSPLVIAHRGFAAQAPENSIAAFEAAFAAGAHIVESDIQITKDGIPVLFHDADLARVAGVQKRIQELDFAELASIDIAGHRVPSLAETLSHFPTGRFNLDVKTIAAAKPAALEIVRFEAIDRVLLTSFSSRRRKRAVAEVRRLLSSKVAVTQSAGGREVILLWFCSKLGLQSLARIVAREIDALQIPPKLGPDLTDAKFVALVRELGLDLHYWSINEVSEMQRLLNLGATGIVTDSTELAKSVISLRALAEGNA